MTPHITKVHSTVKKGCVHQDLYRKTLVVGPNGSGKSTIINTIELACGAFATDIGGRAKVKRSHDLIELATDGQVLKSEAVFSDSSQASCLIKRNGASVSKAKQYSDHTVLFPFAEVKEYLTGSAIKAKKWLMEHVISESSEEIIYGFFEEAGLLKEYKVAEGVWGNKDDATARLEAVHSSLSVEARSSATRLKTLEEFLDEKGSTVALCTENELTKLRQQEKVLLDKLTAFREEEDLPTPEFYFSEFQRLREQMIDEQKVLAEVEATLPPKEQWDRLRTVYKLCRSFIEAAEMHEQLQSDSCMVCGGSSLGIPVLKKKHEATLEKITDQQFALQDWDSKKAGVEYLKELLVAMAEKFDTIKAKADRTPVETVQQIKEEYEQVLSARQSAEGAWKTLREMDSLRDRIESLSGQIKRDKALVKVAKTAITHVLNNAIKAFEDRVRSYLLEEDAFSIFLDQDADRCTIGFLRDGRIHTALSGAEWARMVMAIGMAIDSHNSAIKIFIPEERAYDPTTLSEMMQALSSTEHQVVLTSTVKPSEPQEGWNIVYLGEDQ